MDKEPPRIDTQAHRIVDQRERDERQQCRQHQQDHVHPTQILVHIVHQVLLKGHIGHLRVLLQLIDDPLQRVVVGIVRLQLQFQRCHEGVRPQKFRWVGAHSLRLLCQSLLFTDVVDITGKGAMIQVTTKPLGLVHTHIVTQHHSHRQILLHPCRQVTRCQHREHNNA